MKRLLIIGAGGHGRCCLDIARENNLYDQISFLDDGNVGRDVNGAMVLGRTKTLVNYVGEYQDVFVAMGNNSLRETLMNTAESVGFSVVSLLSPKSVISDYAVVGKGSVVFPGAVIEANAKIGMGCIVAANTTINHDAKVEDYVLINSNTVVRPNSSVGRMAKIGSRCVITFGKRVDAESEILDGEII